MTAAELIDEYNSASFNLKRCECGSKVVMHYTPGCTFIHCIGEKKSVMALPDWQPTQLAEKWNSQADPP